MRTKNSLINMVVGVGTQFLALLLSFINRVVFVHYLSAAYLGVNGLFSNILGLLSLAELGFGSAMVYNLYEPVANGDHDTTIRLMNLYKWIYRWVALVVLIGGSALYPFLDYLIKDTSGVEHLHFIYLMFLANSVVSYLFSYKASMLFVDQRSYVQILCNYAVQVVQTLCQIVVMVCTQNFILYLTVQILASFLQNVLVAWKVDRDYPYLNDHKELPSKEVQKGIWKNVYALSAHKFGGIVVNGTDNLIMSAFVGLESVGIYSNYSLVVNQATYFLNKIFTAFTGSVGNLNATESREKVYEVYQAMDFLVFLLCGYVSAAMFVLFTPFIELFFGEEYLFSTPIVFLVIAVFYLKWMRQVNLIFKDAMGLFWQDRYKPIVEALINLVVSIALVFRYEIVGIFAGTVISTLTTCFWVEPYVLMKYGMMDDWQKKLKVYFIQYAQKTAGMVLGTVAAYYVCGFLPHTNFFLLVFKGIVCTVVYYGIIWLLFGRSAQFVYLKERCFEILKRAKAARKAKGEKG